MMLTRHIRLEPLPLSYPTFLWFQQSYHTLVKCRCALVYLFMTSSRDKAIYTQHSRIQIKAKRTKHINEDQCVFKYEYGHISTHIDSYVLIHTQTYLYILIHTHTYSNILICTHAYSCVHIHILLSYIWRFI